MVDQIYINTIYQKNTLDQRLELYSRSPDHPKGTRLAAQNQVDP